MACLLDSPMGGAVSTSEPPSRRDCHDARGPHCSACPGHLIAFPRRFGPDLERFEFESKHMGTTFRIVLYAADQTTAKKAAEAAFARVAELDDIMSDYKKTAN